MLQNPFGMSWRLMKVVVGCVQRPLDRTMWRSLVSMSANESGRVSVVTKSFSLSCKDAEDKDDWSLRIKGTTG